MPKRELRHVNPESAALRSDGSYHELLKQIEADDVCPFCPENLHLYHKKPIIEEGSFWVLTENMKPYDNSTAHLLAIHKTHIEDIEQMTSAAWTELHTLMIGARALRGITGSTFIMRSGDTRYNGASVSHLHAQLISGNGNEPVLTRVG